LYKKRPHYQDPENYVVVPNDGLRRAYYLVNKDKASNYKIYKQRQHELNYIEIEDKQLIDLLYYSYETYPRKYLFEKDKKPVNDITILRYLRSITNIEGINIDMMRSIYVTHFYANNPTFGPRQELSLKMRHSANTASKNYLKVFNTPVKEINKELEDLKQQNTNLEIKNKELEAIINKSIQPDQKLYNKRRSDIIYKLNNNPASVPRQGTIDKYQLIFDKTTKKYS